MKKSLVAVAACMAATWATVARLTNGDGAAQALAGVLTAPNRASTGTEFGIRHSF